MNIKQLEEKLRIKISDKSYRQLDIVLSSLITSEDISQNETLFNLFKLLKEDECQKFYYVFLKFLKRILDIKSNVGVKKLSVSEVIFKEYLNVKINEFIKDDDLYIDSIAEDFEEIIDLRTPEGELMGKRIVFSYVMNKFRELADMKIDEPTGALALDNLYTSIMEDYSAQSLRLLALIIEDGLKVGNETLRGGEGYRDFLSFINSKLTEKRNIWEGIQSGDTVFKSIEDYNNFMSNTKNKRIVTCKFGFPPIDELTSVYNTDIISIIAMEGTGKTTYMVDLAVSEVLNGRSILFMCGESDEIKILNMMLSHFIYLKTLDIGGYEIKWDKIAEKFDEQPDAYKAIIRECSYDLFTNPKYGKIHLEKVFTYNSFKEEVLTIIDRYPDETWGHIYIDHALSLEIDNRNGTGMYIQDRYAGARELLAQVKSLKATRGLGSIVAGHLKTELEKDMLKGKDIGTRIAAGTGGLTTDVDFCIFMSRNETLKAKNLVKVEVKKAREVEDSLLRPFVVRRDFEACNFYYDSRLQAELDGSEAEIDLNNLSLEELI